MICNYITYLGCSDIVGQSCVEMFLLPVVARDAGTSSLAELARSLCAV